MKSLTPNMAVKNIKETVAYYQQYFGFVLQMAVSEDKASIGPELLKEKEYIWATVVCGEVSLMFQRVDSIKEDVGDFFELLGASATFYIKVDDVNALYESVRNEVEVVKALETTWYGQREFYVRDCNGYVLAFATMESS